MSFLKVKKQYFQAGEEEKGKKKKKNVYCSDLPGHTGLSCSPADNAAGSLRSSWLNSKPQSPLHFRKLSKKKFEGQFFQICLAFFINTPKIDGERVGKMAQELRAPGTLIGDPSLVPSFRHLPTSFKCSFRNLTTSSGLCVYCTEVHTGSHTDTHTYNT